MKKLRLKQNNNGMTLVELLVAVGIFMAAIIPMLYAFVYSTGFNFKAQQTMQSTGIAQAIIEKCKGANTDYDQLVVDLTSGDLLTAHNNFDVGSVSVAGNVFTFENVKPKNFDGSDVNDVVDNGNSNRRSYDVKVTLAPIGEAITDYSIPHTMRSNLTANFLLVDDLRLQDQSFQAAFMEHLKKTIKDNMSISPAPATEAVRDYLVDYLFDTYDIKNLVLERVITITADDSDVKVNVDYRYLSYNGTSALSFNGYKSYNGTNYHLVLGTTPTASLDSAAPYYVAPYEHTLLTGSRASSVFFYYYPAYEASNGNDGTSGTTDDMAGFSDHFILKNDMTLDYLGLNDSDSRLDFYLFKQYPVPDATNTDWVGNYNVSEIEDLDRDYKATIDIESTAPFRTDLYHNLLWNVKTGLSVPTASYPTVNAGTGCYNRTVVVKADPDNVSDRVSASAEDVIQHYKDTFYVNVSGYEHDSYILEDRAVIPYASEKTGVALTGRFGSRYTITVEVYPHGSTDSIETMTSEFLNW